MMRVHLILAFLGFFGTTLSSQSVTPGGVLSPAIWVGACDDVEKPRLIDLIDGTIYSQTSDLSPPLNFNPTFIPEDVEIRSDVSGLGKASFLVVMHPSSAQEQPIWMLQGQDSSTILMTSHRVADLKEHSFINLLRRDYNQPYMTSYFHHLEKSDSSYLFKLAPAPGVIPISALGSGLAEIIVYDRVISAFEKSQLESYLSIKYGVPLSQIPPTNYYNSNRQVIWDSRQHSTFPHDVYAIGRDRDAGLHQKQTNSGALIFSAGKLAGKNTLNAQELPNDAFLFWSHDGLPLEWKLDARVGEKRLARTWLAVVSDSMRHLKTNVYLDVEEIPVVPNPNEIWWIDLYADGDTNSEKIVQSYPFVESHQDHLLVASDIRWDMEGDGSDRFRISAAPRFKMNLEIIPTNCQENSAGLNVRIFGGKGPFRITLKDEGLQPSVDFTTEESFLHFEGLAAGVYHIKAVDLDHQKFEKKIQIVHSDVVEVSIPDMVFHRESAPLILDASNYIEDGESKNVKWMLPDGDYVLGSILSAETPGTYSIFIEEHGCLSTISFEIQNLLHGNLGEVHIYPNPISAGTKIKALINLIHEGPIEIEITDSHGRSINKMKFSGKRAYNFDQMMPTSGTYFLNVMQLHEVYSLPFVVL